MSDDSKLRASGGAALLDAITEINFSYKGDRNAKYRAEFSEYVSQHW